MKNYEKSTNNILRGLIHRFVPAHFNDPFGLFRRLIRSKDSAAKFTVATSLLSFLLSPIDLLFQIEEKRLYKKASKPKLPLIFVTGAPRTGTTVVAQTLIQHLPVGYINNLTAVFQRSPIIANILFEKMLVNKREDFKSYYGKTIHFSGPNDGLHIWDRWIGKNRKKIPGFLGDCEKKKMIQFFGAFEEAFKKPLVNKINSLNTWAELIADALENSYFICMTRNPVYHAQSLLQARIQIHGKLDIAYGIHKPRKKKGENNTTNYIEDVCEQVLFHERKTREQQSIIGDKRFWILPYEEFCEKPENIVERVSEQVLQKPINIEKLRTVLKPFQSANKATLEPKLFGEIQKTLHKLNVFYRGEKSNELGKKDGESI